MADAVEVTELLCVEDGELVGVDDTDAAAVALRVTGGVLVGDATAALLKQTNESSRQARTHRLLRPISGGGGRAPRVPVWQRATHTRARASRKGPRRKLCSPDT